MIGGHNDEYKKCPYCGKSNHLGNFHMGEWKKEYRCGSTISAKWSNDGYTVNYDIKCDVDEGVYNDRKVVGRVRV